MVQWFGLHEEDRRKGPFTSDKSSISNLLKEEHKLRFPGFFPWPVRWTAEYQGRKEEELRKLEF